MPLIQWDDSMATGVAELDAQHQELLQKFNELSDALQNNQGRETITAMVDFLQFYAAWHFGREEECMDYYRCPIAATNQQAHREFLRRFGQLFDLVHQDGPTVELAVEIHQQLANWFVNHIRRIDTGLYDGVARSVV